MKTANFFFATTCVCRGKFSRASDGPVQVAGRQGVEERSSKPEGSQHFGLQFPSTPSQPSQCIVRMMEDVAPNIWKVSRLATPAPSSAQRLLTRFCLKNRMDTKLTKCRCGQCSSLLSFLDGAWLRWDQTALKTKSNKNPRSQATVVAPSNGWNYSSYMN